MSTRLAPTGKLAASVLEQDEVWQDVTGQVRPLAELERSHLANLEPFLNRHGERLRQAWVNFFMDAPDFDGSIEDWLGREMWRPFDDWLSDRPLIRRIRELLSEEAS